MVIPLSFALSCCPIWSHLQCLYSLVEVRFGQLPLLFQIHCIGSESAMKRKQEGFDEDVSMKNVDNTQDEQSNLTKLDEDGGQLEEDQASKSGMEEEGEVVVEGDESAQRNSNVHSEDDGGHEANGGRQAGDGGTKKQKCHRKRPKSTTPVSETPFPIFYCVQYCLCY